MITRSFDIGPSGEEKERTGYVWRESSRRVPMMGDYCKSEDAEILERLLLTYRDGHSVMASGKECFESEGYDGRCEICKMVDRLLGKGMDNGMVDKFLASIRSKNNGFAE